MKVLYSAVIALALAGCGHATGSFLPPIREYPASFQKEMKAELPGVRKTAPRTYEFVKDSVKLRDKIRAGNKIQDRETGGPLRGFFQRK
jgi:hypothetical protein